MASAASRTASENVGWAWQVRARSSDDAPKFHGHGGFGDQFAGRGPQDMDSEDPVGCPFGQNLHHPGPSGRRYAPCCWRASETCPRHSPRPRPFQVLFGLADGCRLGIGVDDTGNDIMIDVSGSARDVLGNRDTFVLGLVRQHRSGDAVADRMDFRRHLWRSGGRP